MRYIIRTFPSISFITPKLLQKKKKIYHPLFNEISKLLEQIPNWKLKRKENPNETVCLELCFAQLSLTIQQI